MRRRALLGGCVGTLVGLAGCQSADSEAGDTTTATTAERPLAVSLLALQPGVVSLQTADSLGVSGTDRQFLVLDVTATDGDAPAVADLRFRFGGTEVSPYDPDSPNWSNYNPGETRYSTDSGRGWVVFELPATGDAEAAALTWPGGEWTPDAALRERLADPAPALSLEWSVPETATVGGSPTLEFTVTNEGRLDGRFVAALTRFGPRVTSIPIAGISRRIPAGETVSFTVDERFSLEASERDDVGDDDPDCSYVLEWTGGSSRRAVRLVE
jgi:hypothetical protein